MIFLNGKEHNILFYSSILILCYMIIFAVVLNGPLVLKIVYIWGGVTSVLNHGLQHNMLGVLDRATMLSWLVLDIYYLTGHQTWYKWLALTFGVLALVCFVLAKGIGMWASPDGNSIFIWDVLGVWTARSYEQTTLWQRVVLSDATLVHLAAHIFIILAHFFMLGFYYKNDATT